MLLGKDMKSYPDLILHSVGNTDLDVRRSLYENIVLSGGTTMFKGIAERLAHELKTHLPAAMKPRVISSEERKYSVWIGGSILSSLSSFNSSWITKAEYQESGAHIVHRKCF